jgi:two-component system chemotaxis response regulator CheB
MRVIVIGTSAGGVQALKTVVGGLPPDLQAAVLIVIHLAPSSPGYMPEILTNAGALPCTHPREGEKIQIGRVYVAPPDQHLLVREPGVVRLSHGPKENCSRPAIDPLFRSAAIAFGNEVIGVILTGHLDDGASGLLAVHHCGGTTVVQDPADAEAPSMPRNAIKHLNVDHCVPLALLAPLLVRLTKAPIVTKPTAMPDRLKIETEIAMGEGSIARAVHQIGDPSGFTCPECHGALLRLRDDELMRFRCHTGHAYTAEALLASLEETSEDAIWSGVRALQERAMLLEHLSAHARQEGRDAIADELARQVQTNLERADLVRSVAITPPDGTTLKRT